MGWAGGVETIFKSNRREREGGREESPRHTERSYSGLSGERSYSSPSVERGRKRGGWEERERRD